MRVRVQYESLEPFSFDLSSDVPLEAHIEAIYLRLDLDVETPDDFCFFHEPTATYVTPEVILEGTIPDNAIVNYAFTPEMDVQKTAEALLDPDTAMKAIFALKKKLTNDARFAAAFHEAQAIDQLLEAVSESSGNQLVLGIDVVIAALKMAPWDALPESFFRKVLDSLGGSKKTNLITKCLEVIALYLENNPSGYDVIAQLVVAHAMSEEGATPYQVIATHLGANDVSSQVNSLRVINGLVRAAGDSDEAFRVEVSEHLNRLNATALLRKASQTAAEDFRKQLLVYQEWRLHDRRRLMETELDLSNGDHLEGLQAVWAHLYPSDAFETASLQWKRVGFHTNDPVPDFAATGLFGLRTLRYLLDTHNEVVKEIFTAQAERADTGFPVALALLNILAGLVHHFLRADTSILHPVLFESDFVFEEMLLVIIRIFSQMWITMGATFLHFPKVMAAMNANLEEILAGQISSLDDVRHSMSILEHEVKGGGVEAFVESVDVEDSEGIAHIRSHIQDEMRALVVEQRIAFLLNGDSFRDGDQLRHFRLTADKKIIKYGPVAEGAHVPDILPNSILVSAIASVQRGPEPLTFLIQAHDPDEPPLRLTATGRESYSLFADGIRAIIGEPLEEPEAERDVEILSDIDMKVRLLELAGGRDVPDTVPEVPPPPSDFNFVNNDLPRNS